MITLVISAIIGINQDDSNGSDDQPKPFIFPTAGSPPPARKTTPTQPPSTRVVITSTPRPTIVLIGHRCNVRNISGQDLPVYAERDTQGEVVGQISTGATFFATREQGEWFSVSGDSLAQSDDGYVHESEIEVIFAIR
jgi:predicted Zn-dependent peptidase